MGYLGLLLAAALVLVVALIAVGLTTARMGRRTLAGMWVGDPGFLAKAELRAMQLFLAPGLKEGYLIMMEDKKGDVVANTALNVSVESPLWGWPRAGGAGSALTVKFGGKDGEAAALPFPSELSLKLDLAAPAITLHDGEKIYAYLVKDPAASTAAIEAWRRRTPNE